MALIKDADGLCRILLLKNNFFLIIIILKTINKHNKQNPLTAHVQQNAHIAHTLK